MPRRCSRRDFLKALTAGSGAALLPTPMLAQEAAPRVVVVGGGFAGASVARSLRRADQAVSIHLVEPSRDLHGLPVQQ